MDNADHLGAAWVGAHLVLRCGEARGLPPKEMNELRYRLAGAWVDYAIASHRSGLPFENSVEREARRLGLEKSLK